MSSEDIQTEIDAASAVHVRIVADSNTVLSGLLWQGGPPREIIDRARAEG